MPHTGDDRGYYCFVSLFLERMESNKVFNQLMSENAFFDVEIKISLLTNVHKRALSSCCRQLENDYAQELRSVTLHSKVIVF